MRPANKKAAAFRQAWERAVERDKPKDALAALEQLEMIEPNESRWPHRAADVLRRMGKLKDAELAYDRAMALYEKQGFMARAIAVAKIIGQLNPARAGVLEGVNHQAARELRAATSKPPPVLTPPPEPGTREAFEVVGRAPMTSSMPAPNAATFATRLAPQMAPPSFARPPSREPPPIRPPASTPPQKPLLGYFAGMPAERVNLVSRAKPLAPSRDTMPDEVRFDDSEETSTDVDLSEFALAELPSDYGPAADEFDVHESPTAERLSLMSGAVLFNDVPREVAQEIARAADLVDLPPGSLVYREGDAADALYIVVDGAVREATARAPQLVNDHSEGEVFGEGCLLEGSVRLFDVVTRSPLLALRIPKSRLDGIVRAHPAVGNVLFELLLKRLVATTVQTSPIFSALDLATRRDVASLFEVRRAVAGTILKRYGLRGDGLYILLIGNLELEKDGEHTWLPPGSTFGQSSLFSQSPEVETIRATSESVLLRLSTTSFGSFAMQFPPALVQIAELGPG